MRNEILLAVGISLNSISAFALDSVPALTSCLKQIDSAVGAVNFDKNQASRNHGYGLSTQVAYKSQKLLMTSKLVDKNQLEIFLQSPDGKKVYPYKIPIAGTDDPKSSAIKSTVAITFPDGFMKKDNVRVVIHLEGASIQRAEVAAKSAPNVVEITATSLKKAIPPSNADGLTDDETAKILEERLTAELKQWSGKVFANVASQQTRADYRTAMVTTFEAALGACTVGKDRIRENSLYNLLGTTADVISHYGNGFVPPTVKTGSGSSKESGNAGQ